MNFLLGFAEAGTTGETTSFDWATVWNDIKSFFTNNYWNIIWFFAALVIGIIVIKIAMAITKRILKATKMEAITQSFLCKILQFLLWLVLILVLCSLVGIEVTGVVTAMSAILLAVGMALKDNIAAVANGIIIVSTQMVKKGDYVKVEGEEGTVDDINFLFTTLHTPDNKRIILPNSHVVNNPLTNYGAHKTRRVDFTFSVAYESDVELVKKIVTDVMLSDGRVYADPKPFCRLKTMNSSSLDFFSHCWCDGEDYWDVYYYVTENVYNEFKRASISVPYDQMEVRMRTDEVNAPVIGSGLPERVEKKHSQTTEHGDIFDDISSAFKKVGKRKRQEGNDGNDDDE